MELVKFLTNMNNLIMGCVAVLAFATIVTLTSPLMNQSGLESRLKSVANRREELRRRSREALSAKDNRAPAALRHTEGGVYKTIVDRLQLSRLLEDSSVVDKLAQAGFRGPQPVTTFYFFRFITPFVLAAAVAVYLYFINSFGLSNLLRMCACVGALSLGYYAPNLYISNVASKRRSSIVAAFPDGLDLLLICVESGMSVEAALQKVSGEIGNASIELAEELSLLVAELSYLPDRRLAYEGMAKRTDHPGVKSVTMAMIQAERYGTPLGGALRTMAKENRDLRIAEAEQKAAALPAQLTVPMIIFFLPVLFVVILGPSIIRVQDIMKH